MEESPVKGLESLPVGDDYLENQMGVSPMKDLKSSPVGATYWEDWMEISL